MAARPSQPEPFVRGAPYPAANGVPYPRANPADVARLPADVWHSGSVPAGVRLELVGDAQAIDIAYRTVTGSLGYRGDGAGIVFSVWRSGRKVCEEEAVLGDGLIRLSLGSGSPDKPAVIYLPEGMQPLVLSLTGQGGDCTGTGPSPLARVRRRCHPGLDRLGARAGMGCDHRPEVGARSDQPRIRRLGPGRDRVGRAPGEPAGGRHLDRLRGQLLDPDAPQRAHALRERPRIPGTGPERASHDADGRDQPDPTHRCRAHPEQARRHARGPAGCRRGRHP